MGEVDFLQLIDNFRLLLRYEIAYRRLEASLRQTIAALERVIGGPLPPPQQLMMILSSEDDLQPDRLPAPDDAL